MDNNHINCMGKDMKIHVAVLWEDVSLCGTPVRSKKDNDIDYTRLFWCYECSSLSVKGDEDNEQ